MTISSFSSLVLPDELANTVQLVWHGANDRANLHQFLSSTIPWAELDVNLDPATSTLILRHDTAEERPIPPDEEYLSLDVALGALRQAGRSVKLDFKVGGIWLEQALAILNAHDFLPSQVWLNGELALLGPQVFQQLAARYPQAILQAPVHFLEGIDVDSQRAHALLTDAAQLGINRLSVPWHHPQARKLIANMRRWGYAFNLYGLVDVQAFLAALAEQPASITADFNFPEWGYYGRGSGHEGRYWVYTAHLSAGQA